MNIMETYSLKVKKATTKNIGLAFVEKSAAMRVLFLNKRSQLYKMVNIQFIERLFDCQATLNILKDAIQGPP